MLTVQRDDFKRKKRARAPSGAQTRPKKDTSPPKLGCNDVPWPHALETTKVRRKEPRACAGLRSSEKSGQKLATSRNVEGETIPPFPPLLCKRRRCLRLTEHPNHDAHQTSRHTAAHLTVAHANMRTRARSSASWTTAARRTRTSKPRTTAHYCALLCGTAAIDASRTSATARSTFAPLACVAGRLRRTRTGKGSIGVV